MIEILRAGITVNGGHLTSLPLPDEKMTFETQADVEAYRAKWEAQARPGVIKGLIAAGVRKEDAEQKNIVIYFKYRTIEDSKK